MKQSHTFALPLALKLVAVLFVIYGAWAAYDVARVVASGQLYLNFGVVCLAIGPGLLARSEIARVCAIAVCVVFLVFTLNALATFAAQPPAWVSIPLFSRLIGALRGPGRGWYVAVAAAAFCALTLWQVWVLMRADVRREFGHNVRFH